MSNFIVNCNENSVNQSLLHYSAPMVATCSYGGNSNVTSINTSSAQTSRADDPIRV